MNRQCLVLATAAFLLLLWTRVTGASAFVAPAADNPNPPTETVKLIFIHHSCGENWLDDGNGGLGIALRDSNYFTSDTNYGWGPAGIGDNTDIGHWWTWFRGPHSATYLSALYVENGQHSHYSRLPTGPSGENQIVMFKSCYPNSELQGNPSDPIPPSDGNPLRGQDCGSLHHTISNAKGIYNDLLNYFASRQDKLFVVITAPPVQSDTWAGNARAFNTWLVEDWLDAYPHNNVAVFDFYNVLTSNGGNWNTNDLGRDTGNHHRWDHAENAIEYITNQGGNTAAYPDGGGDNHPSRAGNEKATGEFVELLNVFYHRWAGTAPPAQNHWIYLPLILKEWSTRVSSPPPASTASISSQLVQPDDLVYVGAFRLPEGPEEIGWQWGGAASYDRERGLLYVFEPLADGDKRLVHAWRIGE